MRYWTHTIALLCISLLVACGRQPDPAAPAADRVLTNGRIYTVNAVQPWAEAVAIRDGEFIYVGDNAGADTYVSEGVDVTDLGGRLVIPGIVDAHTHPGQIDLIQYNTGFTATGREAFLTELEDWAQSNPGEDWVLGCCWPYLLDPSSDSYLHFARHGWIYAEA